MSNCNLRCKVVEVKCTRARTNLYKSRLSEGGAMGQYEDKTLGPLWRIGQIKPNQHKLRGLCPPPSPRAACGVEKGTLLCFKGRISTWKDERREADYAEGPSEEGSTENMIRNLIESLALGGEGEGFFRWAPHFQWHTYLATPPREIANTARTRIQSPNL